MATCDRECETCQYCVTCPISCTAAAIERRERKAGKAAKLNYNRMNDGRQTLIQYGHVATCAGLFRLCRTWKYHIDENTTAGGNMGYYNRPRSRLTKAKELKALVEALDTARAIECGVVSVPGFTPLQIERALINLRALAAAAWWQEVREDGNNT